MELRVAQKHEIVSFDDFGMENPVLLHHENDITSENQLNTMGKCLLTLPDEQRLSIDLFYLQQKCYKEVSDITGYDINKVKSYIQNGKRNLKICMEKQGSGDE
jgi:RNA polymerase sigma-70 factor (ECF subfamily)